ncbi:MAG: ABC transporter substrate-binding protein [Lachnospiraceae bacterium]|nr:ABC transporter substrate-binding protein [Lachnospiraceae bacterium]
MKKRILSAVLAGIMTLSLAACAAPGAAAPAAAPAGSDAAEAPAASGELVHVKQLMSNFGNNTDDAAEVNAAINEIANQYGLDVEIEFVSSDAYAQQLNLMIAGGEDLDVFMVTPGASSFATLSANNSLADIAPYLDTAAPDLKALIRQEYWDACTLDGRTLLVTTWDDKVTGNWLVMDKTILDELGLEEQARAIASYDDITAIYEKVYAAHPELSMVAAGGSSNALTPSEIFFGDTFAENTLYDTLGDQAYQMGAIYEGTEEVINVFETPEWKKNCERMQAWYDAGYVYKDSVTTTDSGETLLKNGAIFSFFTNAEMNCETAKTSQCGKPVVAVKVGEVPVSGGRIRQFGYGVSSTSKHPDAAVKWLQLLYTNADVANLLAYGIEGKHYVTNEDGSLSYPEGVTMDNCGYQYHVAFVVGNYYLLKIWEGDSLTLREDAKAVNETAEVSKYANFSWDNSAVTAEVTATTNVYNKYYKNITVGACDVDAEIEKFNEELHASGLDEIMAAKQEQLNAFLGK